MKWPRHGIQSTTPMNVQPPLIAITVAPTQLIEDAPMQLAQPPYLRSIQPRSGHLGNATSHQPYATTQLHHR
jgi:hypothetical protein